MIFPGLASVLRVLLSALTRAAPDLIFEIWPRPDLQSQIWPGPGLNVFSAV